MEPYVEARIELNGWIKCRRCGHNLGKIIKKGRCTESYVFQTKCHACKQINQLTIREE